LHDLMFGSTLPLRIGMLSRSSELGGSAVILDGTDRVRRVQAHRMRRRRLPLLRNPNAIRRCRTAGVQKSSGQASLRVGEQRQDSAVEVGGFAVGLVQGAVDSAEVCLVGAAPGDGPFPVANCVRRWR